MTSPRAKKSAMKATAKAALDPDPEIVAARMANLTAAFGPVFDGVLAVGLDGSKEAALAAWPPTVWIDDTWRHAVAAHAAGHRSFLVDRPYNRNEDRQGPVRVAGVEQIADILLGPDR